MDRGEPVSPRDLSGQQGTSNERRRTGTTDPSVLERAGLAFSSHTGVGERQRVGERNERRERSGLE